MLWFILGIYWILSLIYCGSSISVARINNVSIAVVCVFAPAMCWVMFGMRMVRTGKK